MLQIQNMLLSRPVTLEEVKDWQCYLTQNLCKLNSTASFPFNIKIEGIIDPVLYSNVQKLQQSQIKGIALHDRKKHMIATKERNICHRWGARYVRNLRGEQQKLTIVTSFSWIQRNVSVHTLKISQTEQNPNFTQTANLSPEWGWWNEEIAQLFQNLGNSSSQGKH